MNTVPCPQLIYSIVLTPIRASTPPPRPRHASDFKSTLSQHDNNRKVLYGRAHLGVGGSRKRALATDIFFGTQNSNVSLHAVSKAKIRAWFDCRYVFIGAASGLPYAYHGIKVFGL